MVKPDIFDELEVKTDPFEELEGSDKTALTSITKQLSQILDKYDQKERKNSDKKITSEIEDFVKKELAKVKPTQNIIERIIERVPLHIPPGKPVEKIIEKTEVIREVEKKDTKVYAEEKSLEELKKEFKETRDKLERLIENMPFLHGGSGVIGIPAPEQASNSQVLTVVNRKAKWADSAAGVTDPLYFGDSATNGSWRIGTSGNALIVERREAGVWVEKGGFIP